MAKVLIGGLTRAHEVCIQGVLQYLGQDVVRLPEPDNEALKIGKIYCNKGQCNPVYYVAGNLIRFLKARMAEGEHDAVNTYYYLTAGACGPCRYGMYEMEYRKALRDAGLGEFRIIAVQQSAAMARELKEIGFSMNKRYFIRFLNSIVIGDIVNNLYYRARPYEATTGAVDRWRDEALNLLYSVFREHGSITRGLRTVKRAFDRLELDYLRPKPRVKIIGEFFSHLQEGDPSYHLPSWLIEEGAEPVIEPLTNWIDYLLWGKIQFTRERSFRGRLGALAVISVVQILKWIVRLNYAYFRLVTGRYPDKLVRQGQLARYASPYYNVKLAGGEGHMEAGKHVYAVRKRQAHMIVSIKPFSCMPSTQSDGVQTKIAEDMHGSLFVSIDTTGDAEVNVKSRILMKLHEAQKLADAEFHALASKIGLNEGNLARLREAALRRRGRAICRSGRPISTAALALHSLVR
jgi:predicted nucleotide-binding protein (sugar kinase/HSP70/actin superfamily)